MKWNKFTIQTTTAAEDFLGAMLDGLGIEGIQIENNVPLTEEETAGMFIDFPPELPEDDGTSRVSFFVEEGSDYQGLLAGVRAGIEELRQFVDVGEGVITVETTEDTDWRDNWKKFFSSFSIDDILIKPIWEPLAEKDRGKILIEIDPGISFGTGKHETTQLCIRQLRKYLGRMPAAKVLDIGCGSGILSVAALKLGACAVVGTDIDEACMESSMANMRTNHLPAEKSVFYLGNLIDDARLQEKVGTEEYGIVVANILADVIIPLAPVVPGLLKQGGIFITSGIIDFKEEAVAAALLAAGLEILETNYQGEWVNITACKR